MNIRRYLLVLDMDLLAEIRLQARQQRAVMALRPGSQAAGRP
jgi:hypothetical protein